MKAWIRVVDAAGQQTPILTVEGTYPGSTDQPSVDNTAMTGWSIGFDENRLVSLRIAPAVRERWPEVALTFQASSGGWSVSYHAVDVKVTALGDEATLTITLLRSIEAPFDGTSDGDVRQASSGPNRVATGIEIRGVLGDRDPSRINGFVARRSRPGAINVLVPEPTLLGDPNASGPGRLKQAAKRLDVLKDGRLIFLEYGDSGISAFAERRRFLVAIWSPWAFGRRPKPGGAIDVVVHFTPTTASKLPFTLVRYPYGARINDDGEVEQPFVSVGIRHLVSFPGIAARILAADRHPVVVVPIAPEGDWGPFAVREGLARFIHELPAFLSVNADPSPASRIPQPLGRIGRVVVTGFSTGGVPAFGVIGQTQPPPAVAGAKFRWDPTAVERWGLGNKLAGTEPWFHEFWDVDTSLAGLPKGTFSERRSAIAAWMANRSDRILRMYRTAGTVGGWVPDAATDDSPPFQKLLSTMTKGSSASVATPDGDAAQVWEDGSKPSRWTIVKFSDNAGTVDAAGGYIGGPKGAAREEIVKQGKPTGTFLSGHELMLRVGIPHAAGVSDLSKDPI